MILWQGALALFIGGALLFGCPPARRGRQATMTVELDIFSGRPNPVWTLSPEESVALAEMLTNLPASQTPAAEGGLGYRGFLLSNPERVAGLPARIRICGGVITIEEDSGSRSYLDTQSVERMLIRQASQRGYGAVLKDLPPPEDRRF